MASSSRIYKPFRAVGVCSNGVPLSLSSAGKSSLVATSVGRTFHVYECNKLHLVIISRLQDEDIECLIQNGRQTIGGVGDSIKIFEGGEVTGLLEGGGRVHTLLLLGGDDLVSVDDNNRLRVWNIVKREIRAELEFSRDSLLISSIVHPLTFINKLLIGSTQGILQLWNIRTSRLIYTFSGWGSAIMCLEQSTALDVVGVGLADGRVILHNIRTDETVMSFKQDWGPVTGLSFRTDGIDTLISTSTNGNIAVWDLNEQCLSSVLYNAHKSPVSNAVFFDKEPLMITNSIDNSIKFWIFDQSDGSARLLKERCGHSAPPTLIRFHPTNPHAILSAGCDNTLRVIGLHRQIISRELSQGSLMKKHSYHSESRHLPPVIDFAFESHRAHQWDSLVTVHQDTPTLFTWNVMNYSLGKHSIKLDDKPLCCCVSGCGHYMFIGTASGRVFMYNIQSGLKRGEFLYKKQSAHTGPVRCMDSHLQYIITGGSDCILKVWSYYNKRLVRLIMFESPLSHVHAHRESGLVGVACDNFQLKIVDVETGGVARSFDGPSGRITDILITPNSRWLIVSSMDCSITTWDIPSAHKVDVFYTSSPALSITISSLGHFLASCHVDELGIFLWSNSTLYSSVSLSSLPSDYNPSLIELPSTGTDPLQMILHDNNVMECEEEEEGKEKGTADKGLIKLSTLAKSQWHCLQFIDTIKDRNKPKEPVQPVKPAPFFLPTQPGLELKFIPAPEPIPLVEDTQETKLLSQLSKSSFQKLLAEYEAMKRSFNDLISALKSMGPSSVDLEFQLLMPQNIETILKFIMDGLTACDDYELIQSYLHLLLKYHFDIMSKNSQLLSLLIELLDNHEKRWKQLSSEMNYCSSLLSYCKSATII